MVSPFDSPLLTTMGNFALALGLGALIGLERERHRTEKTVLAGVRTYPLVSLSGFLAAELGRAYDEPLLLSVGALIIGGFALQMYWVRQRLGVSGLTSPIALFATYFIGVLVSQDHHFEAILSGLAITLLLFTKERLHHLAEVLTPKEMEGALYFLVLAFILYPIAPSQTIDPWDLLNLRNVLLIVILVSLISFLSFLAMRRWGGAFGLPFSGFLGGLVNSEATTISLSNLQRQQVALHQSAYVGILLATATMFVRNLVIAGIADPGLHLVRASLAPLLWPSFVFAAWALFQEGNVHAPRQRAIELESPFAFRPAFTFAFWFTLVSILTILLRHNVDAEGAILLAALGGIVSAGAVTASMGNLVATGNANVDLAAATVVLASLLSAANKFVIARVGGARIARRLIPPTLIGVTAGSLMLLALWAFAR